MHSGVEITSSAYDENCATGQRVRALNRMCNEIALPSNKIVISSHTGVRQNVREVLKAKLRGRAVIREINEWPLSVIWGESRIKQWIEIHLLPKLFDGAICISDVLVDFWKKRGRKGVPILKLPILVDVEEVEKVSGSRSQVSSGRPYVCYVGSMTESKDGVETLRRAMDGVDAELIMVSGKSHEEAISIMKSADCLVLARPDSLQARAGFPTKLGEYLSTGRPVVVTKVGEIPRYLKDGVNAYLAESGSVESVREKILEVLHDPERAGRIGAAGKEVARRCFDWRVHAEELREWLKQFI